MRALFLRGGIAFAAAFVAIALGVAAQSVHGLQPYTALVALWPTFLIPVALTVLLALKTENDPKLVPALGILLVLPFYAAIARRTAQEEGHLYVALVMSAVPMIGLAGFLAGFVLERFPRATVALAGAMTLLTLLAVSAPSLPRSLFHHPGERPDISDVPSMKLAGVLVLDGAAIQAHGVSYRLQHNASDSTWCEVVTESEAPQIPGHRASVVYSCKSRPLRCDDQRRMCLVEDEDYATGYTYDYDAIGVHGYRPPDGRLMIRVEAWILALAAAFLLHRARSSPLRHALAMGSLASAAVGFGMMLRFFDFM
jgi:hypothetical protein